MSGWKLTYFENGRMIEVRIKAVSGKVARAKADSLVPDAVHLTTERILRSGPPAQSLRA